MKTTLFVRSLAALLGVAAASTAWAETEPAAAPVEAEVEAEAEAEGSEYLRFHEDVTTGQLQTAVAHFENADGVKVDLIGAVHIADKAYYEKLNEDFKGYESLLYEMVGDPNAPVDDEAKKAAGGALRFFQNLMKNMLALDFQLDLIDYTAANFVHADMDWKTFVDMREERGETILGMMMKSWEYQAKKTLAGKPDTSVNLAEMIQLLMSSDTPTAMKVVFARQFREMEDMMAGIEGENGSVIVAERNKVALGVLKERIAKGEKNIGIFYGAAHLSDMARRLTEEMGFEEKGADWNTAWDFEKQAEKPAEEGTEPAATPEEETKEEETPEEPARKAA